MRKLNSRQQIFVTAKVAGLKNEAAVISAGYSPANPKAMGTKLMKLPNVIAAIKKAQGPRAHKTVDDTQPLLKDRYTDPLSFMRDCMNNPQMPTSVRFEAAKQMLPYEHARVGEKGKKETKQDKAHDLAGKGRYKTRAAPSNVVALHRA